MITRCGWCELPSIGVKIDNIRVCRRHLRQIVHDPSIDEMNIFWANNQELLANNDEILRAAWEEEHGL